MSWAANGNLLLNVGPRPDGQIDPPQAERLREMLPAIPAKIVRASVLTGGEVSLKQTDGGIELFAPLAARKEMDTIIALQLDSPAKAIQPVPWRSEQQR